MAKEELEPPAWAPDVVVDGDQSGDPVRWHLPEEAPVAFIYNGMTFAVMLASPADLEDFATGFSLSEGVVKTVDEIQKLDVRERRQGFDISIQIPEPRFERLSLRQGRRNIEGRTGCGLCGIDSAERLFEPLKPVADAVADIDAAVVERTARALDDLLPQKKLNRSVHGAAWIAADGEIKLVREDIGRHNALDKLLGAMAAKGVSAHGGGFVLMTSRASYEIVEKAARRGVPALVTFSAPTAFAVRRAREANLALGNWSGGQLTRF